MDYKAAYDRLVQKARQRACVAGYSEKHHVLPRCLGGSNAKDNLVVLSAEEHFLAHQLLVKINPGHRGLILALDKMTLQHNSKKRNNKAYGGSLTDALKDPAKYSAFGFHWKYA